MAAAISIVPWRRCRQNRRRSGAALDFRGSRRSIRRLSMCRWIGSSPRQSPAAAESSAAARAATAAARTTAPSAGRSARGWPGHPRLPAAAAEPQLLRQARALLGIGGRGQRVIARQAPAPQILLSAQAMPGAQVPAQHLALPAAFKADHRVALYRAADRHGGGQRALRLGRLAEAVESAVHRIDQFGDLLRRDVMVRNVAGDNLGDEVRIGALILCLFRHISPLFGNGGALYSTYCRMPRCGKKIIATSLSNRAAKRRQQLVALRR